MLRARFTKQDSSEIDSIALDGGVLKRLFFTLVVLLAGVTPAGCQVLLEIPMDAQIELGSGPAISRHTAFLEEDGTGFCRTFTNPGSWYDGPLIDLQRAGYSQGVDFSAPGTRIEYTARYFQGGGNTNPYGDAPIFVALGDINGNWVWLGISYGPNPDPTYPEWITVTDDMTFDGNPPQGFDLSRITHVSFFGTDWAGTGDDFVDIRNFRVLVPREFDPVPICQIKLMDRDTEVEYGGVVTAVFPRLGMFYIQEARSCGIQVRAEVLPSVGDRVAGAGIVRVDQDTRELYLDSVVYDRHGKEAIAPIMMKARDVGGEPLGNQEAVLDGLGANNTGRLVRLVGRVTYEAPNSEYFYLQDHSGFSEGGQYEGIGVDCAGLHPWQRLNVAEEERITITGISSMYRNDEGEIVRMVRLVGDNNFESFSVEGEEGPTLRALVLVFDPVCPGYGNQKTTQVFGWNDPATLLDGYLRDLNYASGGWAKYEIVDWIEADYHPYFEDGFRYGPDDYIYRWNNRDTIPLHPGTADYVRLITDTSYPHNQPASIAQRVASGEFEEVFIFGAPAGFAGWEAAMAGPSPFFVNGGTYYIPQTGRNFILMGFNYERGVGEMLEDFLHRTECVMSRVYDPPQWWFPTWPLTNNWDAFRMYDQIQPGEAAVGTCHFAPNSVSDYDWGNMNPVWSTSDDWLLNWPNLIGQDTRRIVTAADWGNGDTRAHHVWWLRHLPRAPFTNKDGMQNNWWKYTLTYWNWPESR